MFCTLYNRLCGWVLIALASVGFLFGHIGDYLELSHGENVLCLCLGVIAVWGARVRQRYAFMLTVLVGFFMFLWGIWGMFWPGIVVGSAEPLENAIRIVLGAWGIYVSLQDIWTFRNR
jgi:hypothetical protein